MTAQEQQMIEGLVQRVQSTQLPEKDPEAEQLLQQGLGRNPNSLYILAQTVLVQGYALEQAQKQLADAKSTILQMQQQPAPQAQQKHTSFLGSIFGSNESDHPAPPPPPQQAQYAPVPTYSQPPTYAQPSFGSPAQSSGGGFLRGAMQTAAGVAAGAVAFEGIESLMHGFGGHGGGSGFGGFGMGDAPREEVVNNYYGDDAGREQGGGEHGFLGNDVEDRRNDDTDTSSNFADTGNDDTSTEDYTSSDDTGDSGFGGGNDDSNFS